MVGPSDKQVIPCLIRKLGYTGAIHVRIIQQGELYNANVMIRQLDALLNTQPRISKIIVFSDSECTDIEVSRMSAERTERALTNTISRPIVKYVIVDHSLEGWLLHDLDAVRSVLGTSSTISLHINPEDDCRPAITIRNLFHKHRKSFRKTIDNLKIAERVDVRILQARSNTFAYLAEVIRSP